MNQAARNYWDTYWGNRVQPQSVYAFQFGDEPDKLAELVRSGQKTATCTAEITYQKTNQSLPKRDDYGIVLNRLDEPVAIIKTTDVFVMGFEEVTEAFALAEGDGSLEAWRAIHERYFRGEYNRLGISYDPKLKLVCERFICVG